MIVKVAPNRRDGKSSFEDLGDYITEGIEQSGDRAERTSWDDLTQYITKESVLNALGDDVEKTIAVEAGNVHSLAHAPKEMRATAERCARATNPVLHYILSWPEGERPEPQAIFSAARHTLRALGLQEHQYIIAIHDNTENRHAHIEVNRVHPVTFKAARLEWLYKTLHKAAREAEIEHGWSHDHGLYEVVEIAGSKVIVESRDYVDPDKASTFGANRTETWGGEASLERWCRGSPAQALQAVLANPDARSWQDLHAALAPFGLELRFSGGGGMRVHDVAGEHAVGGRVKPEKPAAVSASKAFRFLKRADAEARFGPFEAADPARYGATPETSYKRDPAKRLERRLARAALREALHKRFKEEQRAAREQRSIATDALRSEFAAEDKARVARQRDQYRALREAIRRNRTLTAEQKQQAYMLAKLTLEQQRAQLREEMRQERAERRTVLAPLPTWREWVEAQAVAGDEAAISALRGLVYQDKRDARNALASADDDGKSIGTLAPASPRDTDPYVRAVRRLSWRVTSHGTVTYRFDSGPVAFVDAGAKLRFDSAIVSDDALRVALRYAADKWKGDIKLNGGDRVFRERVARLATEMRIELRNADLRALQRQHLVTLGIAAPLPYAHPVPADQQRLLFARKLQSLPSNRKDLPHANQDRTRGAFDRTYVKPGAGSGPHAYSGRPGTPAKTIDGVRGLSGVPVVRVDRPAQVLLPDHARDQLEHGRTEPPDALRRLGDADSGMILASAALAQPRGSHRGLILGQDDAFVYQRTAMGVVRHPRGSLEWPQHGVVTVVKYSRGVPASAMRGNRIFPAN